MDSDYTLNPDWGSEASQEQQEQNRQKLESDEWWLNIRKYMQKQRMVTADFEIPFSLSFGYITDKVRQMAKKHNFYLISENT